MLENLRKGGKEEFTQRYLMVGLGNPGLEYRETRHNVGFWVIRHWARRIGVRLDHQRFESRCGRGRMGEKEIILLCPMTFMNRSGQSVKAFVDLYRLKERDLFVIHDDLDLPVGRIRIARDGGAGGHKGVQSIIEHLDSRQFGRIKIGIGRPLSGESVEQYVLEPFYETQREVMNKVVQLAAHACELLVLEGVEAAMNQVNYRNLADKEEKS